MIVQYVLIITCIAVTLAHAGNYSGRVDHVRHTHNVTASLQTSNVARTITDSSNDNIPSN